jgi:hypothetical protein
MVVETKKMHDNAQQGAEPEKYLNEVSYVERKRHVCIRMCGTDDACWSFATGGIKRETVFPWSVYTRVGWFRNLDALKASSACVVVPALPTVD